MITIINILFKKAINRIYILLGVIRIIENLEGENEQNCWETSTRF